MVKIKKHYIGWKYIAEKGCCSYEIKKDGLLCKYENEGFKVLSTGRGHFGYSVPLMEKEEFIPFNEMLVLNGKLVIPDREHLRSILMKCSSYGVAEGTMEEIHGKFKVRIPSFRVGPICIYSNKKIDPIVDFDLVVNSIVEIIEGK